MEGRFIFEKSDILCCAASSDKKELFLSGEGFLSRYDLKTLKLLIQISPVRPITFIASPVTEVLCGLSSSHPPTILFLNPINFEQSHRPLVLNNAPFVYFLKYSPMTSSLLFSSDHPVFTSYDLVKKSSNTVAFIEAPVATIDVDTSSCCYVGSYSTQLTKLDLKTLKKIWSISLTEPITALFCNSNKFVWAGGKQGSIFMLQATGKLSLCQNNFADGPIVAIDENKPKKVVVAGATGWLGFVDGIPNEIRTSCSGMCVFEEEALMISGDSKAVFVSLDGLANTHLVKEKEEEVESPKTPYDLVMSQLFSKPFQKSEANTKGIEIVLKR